MKTSQEIRQDFIEFFVNRCGHTFVPSSPVVPLEDPTLLFANAGMNQFKDVFLATGTRPYKRAVNTQKCIRAGGKHNDLDDVGRDTYHHTFFEMLGNWSFGDYFKKEAITWAWELLTKVWGLDPKRLHVTVFEGDPENGVPADDEAAGYWRQQPGLDPTHIHLGNKKDNFWEMGDTGPCGPCTEIHIDRTPDFSGGNLVNAGVPEVMEIWNLVFIQFNRRPDGKLDPLPAKHVDTGMGFERVTAVLQGKDSNYDTDVFTPIFDAIQRLTGAKPYGGLLESLSDTAYRVIADHIRALVFAITDGAVPSNEKRGYVLRSMLRRAERYGRQYLSTKEPFLHKLVATVVQTMQTAFPELTGRAGLVTKIIFEEEESFLRTLDRGLKLFGDVAERTLATGGKTISGSDAFDLHTTYGLFPDITSQMAREAGLDVDLAGYEKRMAEFRQESGKDRKKITISAVKGDMPQTDDSPKHGPLDLAGPKVLGWIEGDTIHRSGSLLEGSQAALLLDKTNFYAEQGGQIGDCGQIRTESGLFRVEDTQRMGDGVLHVGIVESGTITVGQNANAEVDPVRKITMRHHTTTHMLNLALRKVLGPNIDQKGSLVDGEKTRFDFSHDKALSPDQIREVELLVNSLIQADLPIAARVMALAEAKKLPGVRAVFGEKYPDPVRVVMIGTDDTGNIGDDCSVEFCGGTHLSRSGEAGSFRIISQEAVGKGIRRLTCAAGELAVRHSQKISALLDDVASKLNCRAEDLGSRVDALLEEVKKLKSGANKAAGSDLQGIFDKLLDGAMKIGDVLVLGGTVPAAPIDQLRVQMDRIRTKAGKCVVAIGWAEEGKVGLMTTVSVELQDKVEAGKLVGELAPIVGGKGGGPKGMAQAGGKDADKLPEVYAKLQQVVTSKLS
jgi:alanyl-tRNA synthetase